MADTKPIRAVLDPSIKEQEEESPVSIVRNPGMIPSSMMTTKTKDDLTQYLEEQYNTAEGERAAFIRKIREWKIAYRAPMAKSPKHWPIFNASNLTIPVIKEAVNVLAAQLIQATLTARPRWVFKELHKEWEPFVDDLEAFLDLASDRDLQLPKHAIPWLLETAKLGTGIIEVGHEIDVRRYHRYSSDGLKAYPVEKVMADGPTLGHIPLDKFWLRFSEKDIQSSRWNGKEFVLSDVELRRFAKQNRLYNVEEVIASRREANSNIVDAAMEDIEETHQRYPTDKFRLFETWLSFDVSGGDGPEEIKVYYEHTSKMLMGEFFHPFHHGKRPFIKLGYFPVEDRFYDEGLCEMLEQYQAAISQTVNRRADNESLANSKMILKKKIVQGLKPGDPLYAGKVIETNDPYRDVREFSLGEIYPSTINEEQLLQGRAEKLAGVNEGVAGSAMPVTRTTAAAQLALLQEQAKRIDLAVRSVRDGFNEIGEMCLSLYFQFGTGGKAVAWMGERGKVVESVFRLPRLIEDLGLGITANSPTSMQNRQVKRENKIAMFNLLMQLHKELMPFAQTFAPEQLPLVAGSLVRAAHKYMVDVLETFEETDPEAVLAGIATLEKLLPRPENLGGLESFTESVERAETLDALTRLEGTLREAKSVSEGSRGVRPERGESRRVSLPEGFLSGYLATAGVPGEPQGNGRP